MVGYAAAVRLGAITSGINPRLGRREVTSILERTRPAVTLVDGRPRLRRPGPPAQLLDRSALARRRIGAAAGPADRPSTRPTRWPWSGPAGRPACPRGPCSTTTTCGRWPSGTDVLSQPGDRRLSPLPFAHVGSMTRLWDEAANAVTTVITPTPWRAADAVRDHGRRADHRGPGRPHPVGAGARRAGPRRRRPLEPARRGDGRLAGAARARRGHSGAVSACRSWCATRRPRPRSGPAPVPEILPSVVATTVGRPVPGVDARDRRRLRPARRGRRGRAGAASLGRGDARLLGRPADRARARRPRPRSMPPPAPCSTTTAGSPPATSASSTTAATSTWRAGPTSSTSGVATTSIRPRSKDVLGTHPGRRGGGRRRCSRPGARRGGRGLRGARPLPGRPIQTGCWRSSAPW